MKKEAQDKQRYSHGLGSAIEVIGGKWKASILWEIKVAKVMRFTDLRRCLPEVSGKVLAQQLRELEEDGIICRETFAESPPRVEYSATEMGAALDDALWPLADWGAGLSYPLKDSTGHE
ncbi:HxlR family transcriptional regulator [Variovorax sp. 54]|uniref:winged helix-turn-helix transcriptional regulator n=1 Tax=Variovorax sp. 54 TaxID=2035212 RepID=UPI000C18F85E|nr:helix-turn-helix domain-containing protein [Variovorax sp. 54]PIF73504.1 HxlR family transcriptional regulator [Variovorax sp. 54]